jgi:hypothetical protein
MLITLIALTSACVNAMPNERGLVGDGRTGCVPPRPCGQGELGPLRMEFNTETNKWQDYIAQIPIAFGGPETAMWSRFHRYIYAPIDLSSVDLMDEAERLFYGTSSGSVFASIRQGWRAEHESGETSGASYYRVNQEWASFENFILKY